MKKERFNQLKNKFTNGKGVYIFETPVVEMKLEDLKDYVDYICERMNRAVYFADVNWSFRASATANDRQSEYANLLKLIKNNRPDYNLTEEEKQIACFG